jgi:hypothetical protein
MGTRVKTTSKIIFIIILTFNTPKHLKQLALPKNTISSGRTHEILIKDFTNLFSGYFSSAAIFSDNNRRMKRNFYFNIDANRIIKLKGDDKVSGKSINLSLQNSKGTYYNGLLDEVMME